jgi:hypothetical protein
MNPERHMRLQLWSLLLCAGLLFSMRAAADETPDPVEQAEIRQCRRNLHLIYEAIRAYRRVHKDVPNELAELQPRFLSEARFLACPTARRLGLTSADLTKWGESGQTTYGYELSPRAVPGIISGGSQRSMREWKRLQMGLIGSEVPMVRCHTHERAVLNLSFGGRIYESATLDWEQNFKDVVDPADLARARRLAAHVVVKKIVVPIRNPQAPTTMIDLSDQYNLSLDEEWPGHEPLRPLAGLPAGVAKFDGGSFDVRGAIQLSALRPGLVKYPVAVTNIVIGLPGRSIQLLIGTVHSAAPETLVADCVFHMADGRQQRLQLHYGRHLAVCVAIHEERSGPPGSQIAWTSSAGDGRIVRLFQCQWTNPRPDQIIERMDFVAREGNAGPLLVALSVEQGL